ncbi:mitoferrin-1 isoform X2 [Camelus dromedarius]|uniref:mitoferrin-1 isoform X2 n=1 Tax=Camelus dromedarius TaxID=9838 RepID=UPI0012639FB0|nr:mitoferrin-1 isoform X2 [Camelus dromedarius]
MELRCGGVGSQAGGRRMDGDSRDGGGGCKDAGSEDYENLPTSASLSTHMTAGAMAGILEHSVMYPVDSVKTRMQSLNPDPKAHYTSVYGALKKIIRTEGFWRPLRGLNVMMMGAGPAHAMYFACYENMKRTLNAVFHHQGNSHLANGIAGSMATLLHDAVMNPAEVHPLHHLRVPAGADQPLPGLQPPVPHHLRRAGRGPRRRRHHPAGRLQDPPQHSGEHGPQPGQHQRPAVGHGQRLPDGLPAQRPAWLLQGRAGSCHLPDALHGHLLVRLRVLQVLPHQAQAGESNSILKEWGRGK